jgi:hypothetical protein
MKTEINSDSVFIGGIEYVPKSSNQLAEELNGMPYVMVRTYSAGVHFGYLAERENKIVRLLQTRRVWYWSGAASLSQLALEGSKKQSDCKISVELPEIILTEAIEIIPISGIAKENLKGVKEWKQ